MRIVPKGQPATSPLMLEEIKEHLRLDGSVEDTKLHALMVSAQHMIEISTGLVLVNRQYEIFLDDWPRTVRTLPLPVRPLFSVDAITRLDEQDVETVWPADKYDVLLGLTSAVALRSGAYWPAPLRQHSGLRLTVTAGFGLDWNTVPPTVHQALLLLITNLYLARGDSDNGVSNPLKASGAAALLAPYRQVRL